MNPEPSKAGGENKLVLNPDVTKIDTGASVEGLTTMGRKAYRKALRKQRLAQGDASSATFKGPWAAYNGEEEFRGQQTELTQEQKDLMERYEESRKERLAKAKEQRVPTEDEVCTATTIYHGTAEKLGSKSLIDPPSYLRPKEHGCFIPKKWLHTWNGHSKGV